MCSKEGAGWVLCLASTYFLGSGKSRLCFRFSISFLALEAMLVPPLSNSFPDSSRFHALILYGLSPDFPRLVSSSLYGHHFGSYCACLIVRLVIWLLLRMHLGKGIPPSPFPSLINPAEWCQLPCPPPTPMAVKLPFLPSQLGRMFCSIWRNDAGYSL